jgi:hypothetical protein
MSEYKGTRSFSKKKYYEMEQEIEKRYGEEETQEIMRIFCEVLKFDPNQTVYTERMKECIKARRERLKAEGISTYVSCGAKAYYERKKALSAAKLCKE